MKLPSLAQLAAEYGRTIRRFPLVLVCALLGTLAALILVDQEGSREASVLYNILLTAILALPVMTAVKLAAERSSAPASSAWPAQAAAAALLVVYAATVPTDLPRAPLVHLLRFFALGIGCTLLASVWPFRQKGEDNRFWHFTSLVVFRIMLAGAFALVLFAGLALALAALDNLFGMAIPSKRYAELWILTLGLFAVPYVLAGLPEDWSALGTGSDYPRPLKVLGQYVLPPLVAVYFVILYAYIAKIIVTWSWPQGWVGRLIIGFSATGILALSVLDPMRERTESLWIKRASRWFYLILLPLIVVLFLALWRRISEYGLTEGRYLGLAVGVWLAVIAAYFLLSRSKSIRMIPASLCAFAFLISVGPWGMFSVSEQSQIRRLRGMLTADSILVNGAVTKAPAPVPADHEVQISAILIYLYEVHGFSALEPWFGETLRADTEDAGNRFKGPEYVAELLGIEFHPYDTPGREQYFAVRIDPQTPISVAGYDHMLRAGYGGRAAAPSPAGEPVAGAIETAADSVVVRFVLDSTTTDSVTVSLRPLIDRIVAARADARGSEISGEEAMIENETGGVKVKVVMLQADIRRDDSITVLNSYDALILYSRRK
ncbi:MAG TPA: DUF4153 domain-containing protein [candidate division Zixibacteria bacterium]|mgnify:CR=1 FL=1|nr:DUF4153 domain-containing protein [candidate division Zixibacteria bacterium]MDD4916904.1 DUF4153 domain-containing protein [candidate division Zixibacteria bacterium]MDM7972154.1 DUF4153 domain-containing protein [candidate division Zixibacteria bacterium]HOD66732.1 DUF4153 domain-containing protein [candidate division Zixibacteria bacterium]HOZ07325.1 DUF4153 domain-containing protein [candidate division Zixibacteria bacterium]